MTTYMTPTEVADALGVSVRQVARYAEQGLLTRFFRPTNRRWPVYDPQEVASLAVVRPDRRKVAAATEEEGTST